MWCPACPKFMVFRTHCENVYFMHQLNFSFMIIYKHDFKVKRRNWVTNILNEIKKLK